MEKVKSLLQVMINGRVYDRCLYSLSTGEYPIFKINIETSLNSLQELKSIKSNESGIKMSVFILFINIELFMWE